MRFIMKYFAWSFMFLIVGLCLAYSRGTDFKSSMYLLLSAIAITILEISLSFDNAVVNAIKLSKMSKVWRGRFLTWGILIAVFGMRFVFPILIVAVFANISMLDVLSLALNNPQEYSQHLANSHYGIASFGSMFLLMLFLSFMFESGKTHWLKYPELFMEKIGKIPFAKEIIAFILLGVLQIFLKPDQHWVSIIAGTVGIFLHFGIEALANKFESRTNVLKGFASAGFISFMYLEIIDASFSLDGALSAFAVTKDVVVITIGLAVGAIFVRSLTVVLVEHNTLEKFPYLQHGAYWAVGALSLIMLYSAVHEVSELITAAISVAFILAAVISSFMQGRTKKLDLHNLKIGKKRFRFFR